jgi:DNA-binding CsgD family transcriptional regulator
MIDPDSATLDDLKRGYREAPEHLTCLCCGQQFEKGIVYPVDGRLYEAARYIRHHIETEHQSTFDHLLSLDKSATGLTDLQKRLLALFYQGKSDAEIQKELGLGSTSTVRNHRFLLKERERQAKLFLALMELLRAKDGEGAPRKTEASPLAKYFPYGTNGPLQRLPKQEKQRKLVLAEVVKHFQPGHRYTEAEVNQILEAIFDDHVTLRRYLVDYGLIDRVPDGSQYWRVNEQEEKPMDRRKELQQLAKEIKIEAGVYQIKNNRNGKVLIEATPDLKTLNGKRGMLEFGSHMNRELQQEYNEFGADAFTFEVLEVLEEPETGYFDQKEALKKLKEKWMERLQPYGDRGYHPLPRSK